jgi:dienelactone hydrolase
MTDDCDPIAEFDKLFCLDDKVDNGQRQFDVFISKEGDKPIIVVHELPGMTKPFLCYCIKMANQGFKVYAPLMFGKMGKAKSSLQMLSLCISSEFRKLYWRNQTEGQPESQRAREPESQRAREPESQFTRWLLHGCNRQPADPKPRFSGCFLNLMV